MLRLSTENAMDYLVQQNVCNGEDLEDGTVERIYAKNFNVLVDLTRCDRKFLIKQDRFSQGHSANEMEREWLFNESIKKHPELTFLHEIVPQVIHFDEVNSIVVHRYLGDYQDLMKFYEKENKFPVEIATNIGRALGRLHKATFKDEACRNEISGDSSALDNLVAKLVQGLEQVAPDIFGKLPSDGIKFFVLYQRYPILHRMMTDLASKYQSCCLTHNDLKLNNLLVNNSWEDKCLIRILDWERAAWGDPACDLGFMISSYLQVWLESMMLSNNLSIDESLELASVPLSVLHPSISSLTKAYLQEFPDIFHAYQDFLLNSIQFAGLSMIQQILSMIQYQKTFGNAGIAMLQVAKSLICTPEKSASTVFGSTMLN